MNDTNNEGMRIHSINPEGKMEEIDLIREKYCEKIKKGPDCKWSEIEASEGKTEEELVAGGFPRIDKKAA